MKLKKSTIIKISSVIGIIIVGFVIMTSLGSTEKQSNTREIPPEERLVQTATVNFENIILEIEGNGVIESQKTLNYISEANGIVLYAKNDLKDGTFVRKGELILEVDSREVENQLFTLRSEFLNSIAAVLPDLKIEDPNVYQKWYDYFLSIDIHKTIPELPETATSQEKIKLSTRNIYSKFYAVKNQEILLSKYKITAPFSGYLKANGVVEKSFVTRGTHLFTLSDAINLEISVPLLIEQVNFLNFSSNPKVEIYSDIGNESLTGRVVRKETNLDRNSQTLNVFVTFSNGKLKSDFLPGNYVKVKIKGKQLNDVAQIPRHLVDNEEHVYTMEEGKLARRKVDVVTIQKDIAVIKNTIPDHTKLVTTILQKPIIGMLIKSANESIELKEEVPVDDSARLSQAN